MALTGQYFNVFRKPSVTVYSKDENYEISEYLELRYQF